MKRVTIYDVAERTAMPNGVTDVCDNSDFVIYLHDGIYWIADNQNSKPFAVGTAEDVSDFFAQFIID